MRRIYPSSLTATVEDSGLKERATCATKKLLHARAPAHYPSRPMPDHDARPSPSVAARLAVVNWEYPDRSVVAGCPIDYAAAQAMAKAYQDRYPDRRSWLSIPAALDR